jgi:hypothetical protein
VPPSRPVDVGLSLGGESQPMPAPCSGCVRGSLGGGGLGHCVLVLPGWWGEVFAGRGAPGSAKWGYHSGFATVSVGKESRSHWEGGTYADGSTPGLVNIDEVVLFPATAGARSKRSSTVVRFSSSQHRRP